MPKNEGDYLQAVNELRDQYNEMTRKFEKRERKLHNMVLDLQHGYRTITSALEKYDYFTFLLDSVLRVGDTPNSIEVLKHLLTSVDNTDDFQEIVCCFAEKTDLDTRSTIKFYNEIKKNEIKHSYTVQLEGFGAKLIDHWRPAAVRDEDAPDPLGHLPKILDDDAEAFVIANAHDAQEDDENDSDFVFRAGGGSSDLESSDDEMIMAVQSNNETDSDEE
jgi:hypothetical protein